MALTVLEPGLHTLAVDVGRAGSRALGVPLGGAADRAALAIGNALLGNEPAACALEVTLVGPTVRAECPLACAFFGAPFVLAVGNRGAVSPGRTFMLEAGDVLKIGGTPAGARGYLCVKGGLGPASWEPLPAGATLPAAESRYRSRGLGFAWLPGEPALRVLPGPQFDWFFEPDRFFDAPYEVTTAANRMGIRLAGNRLERRPGELVSEAVVPGAVQITNDGRPVVLGVDGQTIGGYPKIAHVIRADLDKLGQLRPGDAVNFVRVSEADAERAAVERAVLVREWVARLTLTL